MVLVMFFRNKNVVFVILSMVMKDLEFVSDCVFMEKELMKEMKEEVVIEFEVIFVYDFEKMELFGSGSVIEDGLNDVR